MFQLMWSRAPEQYTKWTDTWIECTNYKTVRKAKQKKNRKYLDILSARFDSIRILYSPFTSRWNCEIENSCASSALHVIKNKTLDIFDSFRRADAAAFAAATHQYVYTTLVFGTQCHIACTVQSAHMSIQECNRKWWIRWNVRLRSTEYEDEFFVLDFNYTRALRVSNDAIIHRCGRSMFEEKYAKKWKMKVYRSY